MLSKQRVIKGAQIQPGSIRFNEIHLLEACYLFLNWPALQAL